MSPLQEVQTRIGREDGGRVRRGTDQFKSRYHHCLALEAGILNFSTLRMKQLCLMILKVLFISKRRKCPDTQS